MCYPQMIRFYIAFAASDRCLVIFYLDVSCSLGQKAAEHTIPSVTKKGNKAYSRLSREDI